MLFKGQSYTHQQVNGQSHIFAPALLRRRQPKGFVTWLGGKDGLHLLVERLWSFFPQCWFLSHENPRTEFKIQPEKQSWIRQTSVLFQRNEPLWGEGYQLLTPLFQFWWREGTNLSTGEPLKQNKASTLWPSAFFVFFFSRESVVGRCSWTVLTATLCPNLKGSPPFSSVRGDFVCRTLHICGLLMEQKPIVAEKTWSVSWKPLPQTGSWRRYCRRRKRGNSVFFLGPTMDP